MSSQSTCLSVARQVKRAKTAKFFCNISAGVLSNYWYKSHSIVIISNHLIWVAQRQQVLEKTEKGQNKLAWLWGHKHTSKYCPMPTLDVNYNESKVCPIPVPFSKCCLDFFLRALSLLYNLLSCLTHEFPCSESPFCAAQWGEAISLNILNVTAMQRRSTLGPADQSSAPRSLFHPKRWAQSEISASPEMAPLPQIAFHICVRMSTMYMFNMWPLITARQSIKAISATGAGPEACAGKVTHRHIRGHFLLGETRN